MKRRSVLTMTMLGCAMVGALFTARDAQAQILVSANDAKAKLVDGVNTTVPNAAPDTVTIFDLSTTPPKVVGEVQAPNSVIGPPQNVAVTPNGSLILVASSTRIDPSDATKTVPDDKLTVIDLKASPPKVIATLTAGSGASGLAINRSGTLALVANRSEGTVSVFSIKGNAVAAEGKVNLGKPDCGPSGVAFTPDGRTALVTRNNDNLISILAVDGTRVDYNQRTIEGGLKPYGIEIAPAGDVAVVGNIGAGATGAPDTLSVVDLSANEPRTINHVTVGPTAEGLSISPDGKYVAVTVMNGSNSPKSSPSFNDFGRLRVFGLSSKSLTSITEAKIGHWCQGVAWGATSGTLLVQCMVEHEIQTFTFDGRTLKAGKPLKINGGPAGIFTSRK